MRQGTLPRFPQPAVPNTHTITHMDSIRFPYGFHPGFSQPFQPHMSHPRLTRIFPALGAPSRSSYT